MITVANDITMNDGIAQVNLLLMIPLNKTIMAPPGFEFIEEFNLNNAIKVSYIGNKNKISECNYKVIEYMNNNQLVQKTPVYNVLLKDSTEFDDNVKIEMFFKADKL